MFGPEPTHAWAHWLGLQCSEIPVTACKPVRVHTDLFDCLTAYPPSKALDDFRAKDWGKVRSRALWMAELWVRIAAWAHRMETREDSP